MGWNNVWLGKSISLVGDIYYRLHFWALPLGDKVGRKAKGQVTPEVIKWAKIKMLCDYFKAHPNLLAYRGVGGEKVNLMERIWLLGSGASLKSLDREINKGV